VYAAQFVALECDKLRGLRAFVGLVKLRGLRAFVGLVGPTKRFVGQFVGPTKKFVAVGQFVGPINRSSQWRCSTN